MLLQTERRGSGESTTRTLRFTGSWSLSKNNQLRFTAQYNGKTIRFNGSWKVGRSGELLYTYQRDRLKRGTKNLSTLAFRGMWSFGHGYQLRYTLEGSEKVLEFTGRLARMTTVNGRAAIHYALGVKARKTLSGRGSDVLVLSGIWRPISPLELELELQAPDGKPYRIQLSGTYRLTRRHEITFDLATKNGFKRPGLSVTLERKLSKGIGRIFLRGSTDFNKEHFIGVGGRLTW